MGLDVRYEQAISEGKSFAWEGRWAQAADCFRTALQHAPGDLVALNSLALSLLRAGMSAESLLAYEQVGVLSPSDPLVRERVAELRLRLGDRDGAARALRALGHLRLERGERSAALAAWRQAVEAGPTQSSVWREILRSVESAGADDIAAEVRLRMGIDSLGSVKQAPPPLAAGEDEIVGQWVKWGGDGASALSQARAESDSAVLADTDLIADDLSSLQPAQRDELTAALDAAAEEARHGNLATAEDEYMRLIGLAPGCLAVQVAYGDFLAGHGRIWEAWAKYSLIGRVYRWRALPAMEAAVCQRMLLLAVPEPEKEEIQRRLLDLGVKSASEQPAEGVAQAEVVEKPSEELGQTAGAPAEQAVEQPIEQAAEQLVEYPVEQPTEQLVEQPAEQATEQAVEQLVEWAVSALDASWPQAASPLEELAEAEPAQPEPRQLALTGRLHEAAAAFAVVLESSPCDIPATVGLGLTMALSGDRTGLESLLMEFPECVAQDECSASTMGDFLSAVGGAEALAPAEAYCLGVILLKASRPHDALALLRQSAEDSGALSVYAHLRCGRLLLAAGDAEEATEEATQGLRALRLAESDMTLTERRILELSCHLLLADSCEATEDWRKVAVALYEVTRLSPDDEQARVRLAEAHFRLGESALAAQELRSLIDWLEAKGSKEQAAALAATALQIDPADIQLRTRLAGMLVELGNVAEALRELASLAETQMSAGESEAARSAMRRMLEIGGDEGLRQVEALQARLVKQRRSEQD